MVGLGNFSARFRPCSAMSHFVKICCIKTIAEAKLAIDAGASALGLVSKMPSGPGVISDEAIAEITASVPRHVETFLLTKRCDAESIIAQHRQCKTSALQLVDTVSPLVLQALRRAIPHVKLVQVIRVAGVESITNAVATAADVDAILLDSGNTSLTTKELGGTGRTHDWRVSDAIRRSVSVPIFLAGGLSSQNVRAAIRAVQPYGVDLCSGVRTDDKLDAMKLEAFFRSLSPENTSST